MSSRCWLLGSPKWVRKTPYPWRIYKILGGGKRLKYNYNGLQNAREMNCRVREDYRNTQGDYLKQTGCRAWVINLESWVERVLLAQDSLCLPPRLPLRLHADPGTLTQTPDAVSALWLTRPWIDPLFQLNLAQKYLGFLPKPNPTGPPPLIRMPQPNLCLEQQPSPERGTDEQGQED